jgi:putative nucleotidyltransferase with HDIG domain
MKRILFVDDEPELLDGLQRMLRGMRREWEMEFSVSGADALAVMEARPFHVVVTDMRMPGMDGCELLNRVKELYPQAVRIVLSGHTNMDSVLKTVGLAHQYLSKPCDADLLKATINRACSPRDLLDDGDLVRVISGIERLPSLPTLYSEVMKEMASEDSSLNRVGEIIAKDSGMSAKILQLVNSAFFGLPRHVTNPVRAVHLLGLEIVKALILSVKIFSQFSRPGLPFTLESLWKHSMSVGFFAKAIAREAGLGQETVEEAFMAGLLHDVGKLILVDKFPEKWTEMAACVKSEGCNLWEAERHVLGTSHAQIGAYLLGIWGLSESIVEAVNYHHNPDKCPNAALSTLTAVYAANMFEAHDSSDKEEKSLPEFDREYLGKLGVFEQVETWRAVCRSLVHGESYV